MMIWLGPIFPVLPELLTIFGALCLLIYGVFSTKESHHKSKIVSYYSATLVFIAFIFSIAYVIWWSFEETRFDEWFSQEIYLNEMLNVDAFSASIKSLLFGITTFILLMVASISDEEDYLVFEVPILILISLSGMILMLQSNGFIAFYLSLELMSLPLYILASINRNNAISAEAGLKYFILGAVSSAMFLFGVSWFYTGCSITNNITENELYAVSYLLLISSFAFKIAAVPGHMWAPDVYQGSPTSITAFFATTAKIAAIFGFVKLLMPIDIQMWIFYMILLSILSVFIGSLGAIMQKSFKRLLAYSGIVHIGFVLMGLATASIGIQSVLVYSIIYSFMTIGVFTCLLILKFDGLDKDLITNLSGISKTHPYLAFSIAVLMFSMAGIPPFAGFFAKFYIIYSLISQDMQLLAIFIIIASVIAAYYYLYIVKVMYFDEAKYKLQIRQNTTLNILLNICILFNILYCIAANKFWSIASLAAEVLMIN